MSRLVLIGGTAGTGKSTAARAVAGRLGAAWLQLDTLWIAMRDAAPAGSDERLRLDIDSRIRSRTDPLDELVQHHIAASAAVCAALPHALAFELQTHPVVVADGAWLLPEFMRQLVLPGVNVTPVLLYEGDRSRLAAALTSRRGLAMVADWQTEGAEVAWRYGNWLVEQAQFADVSILASQPYDTIVDRIFALVPCESPSKA